MKTLSKKIVATASMLLLFVGSASAVTVTVPGTANGGFGSPNTGGSTPFVAAITVTGPGTISIAATGTINFGGGFPSNGPNGGVFGASPGNLSLSLPLDEAVGMNSAGYPGKQIRRLGALIGAFVPQSLVSNPLFQPVDGTKGLAPIGIVPSQLFFVGNSHVIEVNSAGTLYLGINDGGVVDNSGAFTVNVTTP